MNLADIMLKGISQTREDNTPLLRGAWNKDTQTESGGWAGRHEDLLLIGYGFGLER